MPDLLDFRVASTQALSKEAETAFWEWWNSQAGVYYGRDKESLAVLVGKAFQAGYLAGQVNK